MPAWVAGIHVATAERRKDVDGRTKSGHDNNRAAALWITTLASVPIVQQWKEHLLP